MNKYFLLLVGLMSVVAMEAQVINDSGNHSEMLITLKENPNLNKVEGSPYLDDDFKYGTATIDGKEPLNVYMRFDVSTDQMEIKTDPNSEDTYVLPLNRKAVYRVGGKKFLYDDITVDGQRLTGYFIEHYDGNKVRLLEKPTVEVTEAVKAKTGYDQDRPAQIKIDSEFFIVKPDGDVEKVEIKHRDIKKKFESKKQKEYLSDNRIRSVEDLKAFVVFLDQQ